MIELVCDVVVITCSCFSALVLSEIAKDYGEPLLWIAAVAQLVIAISTAIGLSV